MQDLIIVIPGIMGSTLEADGTSVWNPGPGMLRRLLRASKWLEQLSLDGPDDPADPVAADGVTPTGLVESQAVIPGFQLVDGYSELHTTLRTTFGDKLIEGDPHEPASRVDGRPATHGCPNYFRFPYDWRRDLRSAAVRLDILVAQALPTLRRRSPNAKVLIAAHSMGGLVARYWIEGIDPRTGDYFDGWKDTRELLTFGTPFRGSADAIANLANGIGVPFIDFRRAMGTMPGIHQLVPRYRCVLDSRIMGDKNWHYPKDIDLPGVSRPLATAAYEDMYEVIDRGIGAHSEQPDYRPYLVPLIGYGHRTTNSVELTDEGVKASPTVPAWLDQALDGGDGTVPAVSAIPLDLDADRLSIRHAHQKHGSLQTDAKVLGEEIRTRWRQSQSGTGDAAGATLRGDSTEHLQNALTIDHVDFAGEGEPITIETTALGLDVPIELVVIELGGGVFHESTSAESSSIEISPPAGEYRVEVRSGARRVSSGLIVLPGDS